LLLANLDWKGPVFEVSAVTGDGLQPLLGELMEHLKQLRLAEQEAAGEVVEDDEAWDPLQS